MQLAAPETSADRPALRGRSALFGLECVVLALILAVTILLSACIGDSHLSLAQVVRALRDGPNGQSMEDVIVWAIRLPRILQAVLIGAMLSISGLAFQALLRNVLADPYVIGVSAAASVGSEAVLLYGGAGWMAALGAPAASFLAGTVALTFLYGVARRAGRLDIPFLLLMGTVLGSFLGGIATLMLIMGPPRDTAFILGRMMGSLGNATFGQDAILGAVLVMGALVLAASAFDMNVTTLGDVAAMQLGIPIERLTRRLLITGSLLAATTVAMAGAIGFVGFVTPHLARRIVGSPDHRRVLPVCLLLGGTLVTVADTIARAALPDGREIPVGIVTALLGAPIFLKMMRQTLHRAV